MPHVVAVFCSVWRPGPVVFSAVSAALSEPLVNETLVFGYEPTGRALWHKRPRTIYHDALDRHAADATTDYLCAAPPFKRCGVDDAARVKWRAALCLDMWACFRTARRLYPASTLLWLENDAILLPGKLGAALSAAARHGAASCYGSGGVYGGGGALCLVFTPSVDPTPHILSYHLVQPVDWILSDFSRGRWPIAVAARHGTDGTHASTRLLL